MTTIPTSHAARVQAYLWALEACGIDVEARLARTQLPSLILYEPDLLIPSRSAADFILRTAREEGIDNISMLGAARDGVSNLEPRVLDFLLAATTLEELLGRYCRLARRYVPYRKYTLEHSTSCVRIGSSVDRRLQAEDWVRLSEWSNTLLLLKVVRYVLGPAFQPDTITLQTSGKLNDGERAAFPNTDILRGATSASITFPKDLLATPLPDRLQEPAPVAEFPLGEHARDFPAQMRELLKTCIAEDWVTLPVAAEMAGSSVRTFQRRLSEFGLTFSELLNQARMDVARTLLSDAAAPIIDVGLEVGFEDPAHFTRAFRRMHGVTPMRYRKSRVTGTS